MDGLTPGGETTTHHPTTIKCSIRALACELIDILDDSVKTSSKVAIDTDGLKTINAFGLDVFLHRMSNLNNNRADIQVTGRFSEVFKEA